MTPTQRHRHRHREREKERQTHRPRDSDTNNMIVLMERKLECRRKEIGQSLIGAWAGRGSPAGRSRQRRCRRPLTRAEQRTGGVQGMTIGRRGSCGRPHEHHRAKREPRTHARTVVHAPNAQPRGFNNMLVSCSRLVSKACQTHAQDQHLSKACQTHAQDQHLSRRGLKVAPLTHYPWWK